MLALIRVRAVASVWHKKFRCKLKTFYTRTNLIITSSKRSSINLNLPASYQEWQKACKRFHTRFLAQNKKDFTQDSSEFRKKHAAILERTGQEGLRRLHSPGGLHELRRPAVSVAAAGKGPAMGRREGPIRTSPSPRVLAAISAGRHGSASHSPPSPPRTTGPRGRRRSWFLAPSCGPIRIPCGACAG